MILEIFMTPSGCGLKKTEYDILLSAVPEEKRQQIEMQKVKHNADNSLIGIALVMAGVSKTFGIPVCDIALGYKNGKPYIKNHENIFVSISHSKDLVVCAVADVSVGVDVEKIRPYNSSVARKVLHKTEPMSDSDFTKEWTVFEATFKLKGTGHFNFKSHKTLQGTKTDSVLYNDYWITAAYKEDI